MQKSEKVEIVAVATSISSEHSTATLVVSGTLVASKKAVAPEKPVQALFL